MFFYLIKKHPFSNKRPHSNRCPYSNIIYSFKHNQSCHTELEWLKIGQQAMSNSHGKDPFDVITKSHAKDTVLESF